MQTIPRAMTTQTGISQSKQKHMNHLHQTNMNIDIRRTRVYIVLLLY